MTTSHLKAAELQWPLTVLYDSNSKVSARELADLKSKDKGGRIKAVDISAPEVSAADYGVSGKLGNEVYVRDAAGHVYTGATALEAAYEAVGMGSYFRFTRLPAYDCTPGRLSGH